VGIADTTGLKHQEYVVKSKGSDIFLFGEGKHGSLNAVMHFLEHKLGWRWYSVHVDPVMPEDKNLTLKPFSIRRANSFESRQLSIRWNGFDFAYQNGVNDGLEAKSRRRGIKGPAHVVSYRPCEFGVHTLHVFIPPTPDNKYGKRLAWNKKRDYFKTNPDFFTMAPNGKRVPNKQLCLSNPELRKELTNQIMEHLKIKGTDQYITVDAADTPDAFCYCKGCVALEKKYQSPGGPLYDYLFEVCDIMKKKHPGVMIKTLAYRRAQTQIPPVLEKGKKFPDNLMVSFAGIEDEYFADWTHPDKDIQETYRHLKEWAKIVDHTIVWIYPNPWRSGHFVPVGNVERTVNCMKTIYAAGARGVFVDHNGYNSRSGFANLQAYLIMKLGQDIKRDPDAIIKEYTDFMFGKAAPLTRKYIKELEAGRKKMLNLPPDVTYRSSEFDLITFPYLTVENIYKWSQYFDEMEKLTVGAKLQKLNVDLMRRELDVAVLWRWFDLQKKFPAYFRDHKVFSERFFKADVMKSINGNKAIKLGDGAANDFLAIIAGGGKRKPLPEQFAGIDKSKIKEFIPKNYGRSRPKTMIDKDAAFGYAAKVDKPDMPFNLGFYQWLRRNPPKGKHGPRLKLDKDKITPGVFKLYKLGEITVIPDSIIWFSSKSWATSLSVGKRLYEPGEANTWDAYVSLKLDGPSYGGKAEKDVVLCDRIICVKKF
jgi:hypothetical protein